MVRKNCVVCGAVFRPKSSAITCGPVCSLENRRVKGRRYDQQYRKANPSRNLNHNRKFYSDPENRENKRKYDRERASRQTAAMTVLKELVLGSGVEAGTKPCTTEKQRARWRRKYYLLKARNPDRLRQKHQRRAAKRTAALNLVTEIETKGIEALL